MGCQVQVDAFGRWRGDSSMWTSTQKYLNYTEAILPSSHAKKLAFLGLEFCVWTEKRGNFSSVYIIININKAC